MMTARTSFVERANRVRKRVPFAYWLVYDAVIGPLLVWGLLDVSQIFAVGLAMLAVAAFFDVNEAVVKWSRGRCRCRSYHRRTGLHAEGCPRG